MNWVPCLACSHNTQPLPAVTLVKLSQHVQTDMQIDTSAVIADCTYCIAAEIQATMPSKPGKPSHVDMWKGVILAYVVGGAVPVSTLQLCADTRL